jgi:hypothetical protein
MFPDFLQKKFGKSVTFYEFNRARQLSFFIIHSLYFFIFTYFYFYPFQKLEVPP